MFSLSLAWTICSTNSPGAIDKIWVWNGELSWNSLFLSYRRPMCTRTILVIFVGHLGFDTKITSKHNSNARNWFVALKLMRLEVLLGSLCYIGQNLGIPQIQDSRRTSSSITKMPTQIMIKNHRFWTLRTIKQFSWKKSQLFISFFISKSNAPGLERTSSKTFMWCHCNETDKL